MKGFIINLYFLLLLPAFSFAQQIVYSDVLKENSRDMDFEIIGKINGNILVFKNQTSRYAVSVYQGEMDLKEKVDLDFIPSKAYNVDFVVYQDFFYLIYQYQKKGVVYCMAAKLDGNVKKMGEPIILDTTQVSIFGDNKIYSVINSEDKQKIMVFKIQKKDAKFNFVTLLYDKQLQLLHKTRQSIDYDDRKDVYSDFFVDNDGNFIFAKSIKSNRDDIGKLGLVTKGAQQDTFSVKNFPLNKLYVDEIKLKVDNVNKRYIINSFYYNDRRGNITGVYSAVWDAKGDSNYITTFTPLADDLRAEAKEKGNAKYAFNDFFIRDILLKNDGGYLIVAEDYSTQTSGNNSWNRWDYLYNSPYSNPYYYNYYSPYGGGYGRYGYYNNNFNNNTRYYYYNIMVLSISNTGQTEWSNIIHKEQSSDNTDNFLSYTTFNTGADIHFLFNNADKRNQLLVDNVITPDGALIRNPSLKSNDKGYEFMIRFAKQTGARQIIVPCSYRQQICFAKIEF